MSWETYVSEIKVLAEKLPESEDSLLELEKLCLLSETMGGVFSCLSTCFSPERMAVLAENTPALQFWALNLAYNLEKGSNWLNTLNPFLDTPAIQKGEIASQIETTRADLGAAFEKTIGLKDRIAKLEESKSRLAKLKEELKGLKEEKSRLLEFEQELNRLGDGGLKSKRRELDALAKKYGESFRVLEEIKTQTDQLVGLVKEAYAQLHPEEDASLMDFGAGGLSSKLDGLDRALENKRDEVLKEIEQVSSVGHKHLKQLEQDQESLAKEKKQADEARKRAERMHAALESHLEVNKALAASLDTGSELRGVANQVEALLSQMDQGLKEIFLRHSKDEDRGQGLG